MGGGLKLISLVYTPPFLRCGACEGIETAMTELSVTVSSRVKVIVAQLCRATDHEIINEGAECERSENAMQFLYHRQLDRSLPFSRQLLGWCIAGQ